MIDFFYDESTRLSLTWSSEKESPLKQSISECLICAEVMITPSFNGGYDKINAFNVGENIR